MRFRSILRAAIADLLHKPDEPMFVDLAESQRKSAVREAEYQAQLDQQSGVLRTSSYCRRLPRRQVAALVERRRERV